MKGIVERLFREFSADERKLRAVEAIRSDHFRSDSYQNAQVQTPTQPHETDVIHAVSVLSHDEALIKGVKLALSLIVEGEPTLLPLLTTLIAEERLTVRVIPTLKQLSEALGITDFEGAALTTPHLQEGRKHYEMFLAAEHLRSLGAIIGALVKQLHGIDRTERREVIHLHRYETISLLSRSIKTVNTITASLNLAPDSALLAALAGELAEVIEQDQFDIDELLAAEEVFSDCTSFPTAENS
jgi:hypothetical protein